MLRHGNDICARYLLIPGKALQQENAAVQVDTDVYGFPTRSIHMGALKADMSSTVHPAQQSKAEHNPVFKEFSSTGPSCGCEHPNS
jgi:hypothetical protein